MRWRCSCCVLQSDVVNTKDWILKYAECETDSDNDEFGEEEDRITKCQEVGDRLDPVLWYIAVDDMCISTNKFHKSFVRYCLRNFT